MIHKRSTALERSVKNTLLEGLNQFHYAPSSPLAHRITKWREFSKTITAEQYRYCQSSIISASYTYHGAQSRLDLNTIEHLWTELNRRVIRQPAAPNSLRELQQTLIQELRSISQAFIQNYVSSMRQRCLQVFGARGGHTRYMYKLDVLYSKVTYDKMSLSCDFIFLLL